MGLETLYLFLTPQKALRILLILFIPYDSFSQSSKELQLADSLSKLGNKLLEMRHYDSAIVIIKKSTEYYKSQNNRVKYFRNFNDIGTAFHWQRNYDSALYYYQLAKDGLLTLYDSTILPMTLNNIGIIQKKKGQYDNALGNTFISLDLNPNLKTRAAILNTIASIYLEIKEYEKSISYYKKALEDYLAIGNNKKFGFIFNNIGSIYNKMDLYDSAIFYLNKSLEIKHGINDQRGIAKTLNNLGLTYLNLKDLKNAKEHLTKSLALKEQLKDSIGMSNTLNLLAEINLKENNLGGVKDLLERSYLILQSKRDLYILRKNLWLQSKYFKSVNNTAKESEALRKHIYINDSLLSIEKARALEEMQVKYESEKKDQEIAYLQEIEIFQKIELASQERLNFIYLFCAVILGILLAILARLFLTNRRKKAQIEHLNQEMQHRIKNNLQVLSGILKLQNSQIKDHDALSVLKTGESRINAMVLVHQLLFQSSEKRKINVQQYVSEMCQFLQTSFNNPNNSLSIRPNIESILIDIDQMISIGLIVNELITNSIKHAFKNTETPVIEINFNKLDNGNYFLEFSDNGIGFKEEEAPHRSDSFGMKLIKMLGNQLGAQLNLFNRNGAVFQFSIPYK